MKSLDLFLKYVLIHVTGCSEPLAIQTLAETANDFCKRTLQAQLLETQSLTAGQQNYEVPSASGADHHCVLGVFAGRNWLLPATTEQVRDGTALAGAAVGAAALVVQNPTHYFMRSPEATEISLFPTPQESIVDGLVIRTAYATSLTATSVPDHLFNRWQEVITAGTLYRLHSIPGQPWSSEKKTETNRDKYYRGIRKASIEAKRGMAAASSRVVGPAFA